MSALKSTRLRVRPRVRSKRGSSSPSTSASPVTVSPETAAEIQALSRSEFEALWLASGPDSGPVLVARCRTDLELFCLAFLGEWFPAPWSPIHRELLDLPKVAWSTRTNQRREAWIAPRKSAKTTLAGKGDIVHDIVYGYEVCVMLFSTKYEDAERMVKEVYQLFTEPTQAPELHAIFGPFTVTGTATEFSVRCATGDPLGTQLASKSFGSSGRGHLYRGRRPSKVVMDDIVHPQHVQSPDQRAKDWRFLNGDVLKSGDVYTLFRMLNTIQHADDTPSRTARDPRWRVRRWRALVAWPKLDRWEELRALWANLEDPDREETARSAHALRSDWYDEGAVVLWPSKRPLIDLMFDFWADPASFFAEDQNEPRDPSTAVFDLSRFRRCRFDGANIHTSRGTVVALTDCKAAIWLDPSSGKAGRDRPAIAAVVMDRYGWRYVVSVEILRRAPTEQHRALWAMWERLSSAKPRVGTDETGTQGLLGEALDRMREDRRKAGKAWALRIDGYALTGDKKLRIDRLEPDLHNGFIELDVAVPGEVLEEFRDHPTSTWDDAMDAIERADWLLTDGSREIHRTAGLGG